MPAHSAGLLVFRRPAPAPAAGDPHPTTGDAVEVLLVHPGGPFWARRDDGAWSLPKGEHPTEEEPLDAARREFGEELGVAAPEGPPLPLGEVRQAGGKRVTAWAVEADLDVESPRGNTFSLEWPPRSGVIRQFPEVDRAGWFDLETARRKILAGQRPFLDRLAALLALAGSDG